MWGGKGSGRSCRVSPVSCCFVARRFGDCPPPNNRRLCPRPLLSPPLPPPLSTTKNRVVKLVFGKWKSRSVAQKGFDMSCASISVPRGVVAQGKRAAASRSAAFTVSRPGRDGISHRTLIPRAPRSAVATVARVIRFLGDVFVLSGATRGLWYHEQSNPCELNRGPLPAAPSPRTPQDYPSDAIIFNRFVDILPRALPGSPGG